MNDVQRVLWDMQGPVYAEINKLEAMVINSYSQASLNRLNKIEQLIKDAWKASEEACCDLPQDLRKAGIHRLHGCTTLQAMDITDVCGSQWRCSNYGGVILVDLNLQDEYYHGEGEEPSCQ
jgi:hypothetical protein